MRIHRLAILGCLFLIGATAAEDLVPQEKKDKTVLPYVLVSPNAPADGGDFGPSTPGTKTAGLQEAVNYARKVQRDVRVAGGGAKEAFKNPVVYFMSETLRIP